MPSKKHLCDGSFDPLAECELHTCPEAAVEFCFPCWYRILNFEGYISVGLQLWNVRLTCNILPCEAWLESSGGALLKQLHRWVCNSEMEKEICIIGPRGSSIIDPGYFRIIKIFCWYCLSSNISCYKQASKPSQGIGPLCPAAFSQICGLWHQEWRVFYPCGHFGHVSMFWTKTRTSTMQ